MLNRLRASALVCVLAAVPACAALNPIDPIAVAQTPDQQAFALLSAYAAVLETAADLARDPAVPAAVKRALSEAEATATPVVLALAAAFDAYAQTPDEAAAQALADATARAQSPLVALQAAVLTQTEGDTP